MLLEIHPSGLVLVSQPLTQWQHWLGGRSMAGLLSFPSLPDTLPLVLGGRASIPSTPSTALVRPLRTMARQSPSDPWKSSSLLISAETWEERNSENVMPNDCWKGGSEEKCENVKRIVFLAKSFVSGTLYYYMLNQWYLICSDGSLKIGFSFFPLKI